VISPKLVAMVLIATFSVVACGAATSATTGPGATAAPAATRAAAATAAPVATAAPAATAVAASAAATVDSCALISPSDLKTVTGDTYGAGVSDFDNECVWRVGGATSNTGKGQVIAYVQDQALSFIKTAAAPNPGGVDLTVAGHTAYWNPSQGLQTLWIDLGGRTLGLSFDPVDADTQGMAVKLAEIAVARM